MPLETNIEYRKRLLLNRIVREEISRYRNITEIVQKAVYRWQSALSHPRNFSDFNTNISWISK
jgi:hypothetical protein